MIDIGTLQRWTEEFGYSGELDRTMLRIRPREEGIVELPPFIVQCTGSWVVLSMFGVLDLPPALETSADPDKTPVVRSALMMLDTERRLLEANRDMRVAKFAVDERGEVVLCAELPTESLDRSEFEDTVERMIEYATTYRRLLLGAGA